MPFIKTRAERPLLKPQYPTLLVNANAPVYSIGSSNMESSKHSPHSPHDQSAQETPYEQEISALPRNPGWLTPEGNPHHQYEGFWYATSFIEGLLALRDSFKEARPSDIIVSSPPKSGTTWLKALTFAICTRNRLHDRSPLLASMPHDLIPLLEIDLAKNDQYRHDNSLPLLSTHIPYSSLPKPIIDSGCKIVYIWRDPKDVFISLWHFTRKITMKWFEGTEPISLEKAFDMFCQGNANYGPYWDHVLGYWKASLDRPDKILVLKYEDMIAGPAPYVKGLAEFMGFPFSEKEETEGEIGGIIRMCSFDNLSNLEVNKSGKHRAESPSTAMDNNMYFRKAKVGDWQNYLTKEMAEKIDQITSKKFHGSGLTF